jgi:uncharacterized RDD family membrane protein YckC
MKCPKCGYLGFQQVDRCRNCGYDFSLTAPAAPPELPMRSDRDGGQPLPELSLVDGAATVRTDDAPDLERVLGEPVSASSKGAELPLFGDATPDDVPLIARASPPRQPLAVRRATPEVPRLRPEQPRMTSFDLALDPDPAAPVSSHDAARGTRGAAAGDPGPSNDPADAGVAARLVAVVIDLLILAVVDAVVVYFTMRICEIGFDEIALLPKGPLLAFLLVQNGGYLVAFTAGGQTLGKMAAGIRVVCAESESTLDLGRAFLRTVMWVALAVPAGLGFLTALFSRDHRGLHDRFAGTRVVR